MNYKAISFRLNLDDVNEAELYEKIKLDELKFSTTAGCIKHALAEYYNQDCADKTSNYLETLIRQETDRIIDRIQNISINQNEYNSDAVLSLPESTNQLPDQLAGVLDLFE